MHWGEYAELTFSQRRAIAKPDFKFPSSTSEQDQPMASFARNRMAQN